MMMMMVVVVVVVMMMMMMMSSVRPSVVCLSNVRALHPTQASEIFDNIFILYERSFILVF